MKIAFVGKGGSTKSTTLAIMAKYLSEVLGWRVVVVNADVNDQLGFELGADRRALQDQPRLGRGDNSDLRARVAGVNPELTPDTVLKATPFHPGNGCFIPDSSIDPLFAKYSIEIPVDGDGLLYFITMGEYSVEELKSESCMHAIQKGLGPLISHTIDAPLSDGRPTAMLLDCPAGIDPFASGWLGQCEMVFGMSQGTAESFAAFRQIKRLSEIEGVQLTAIGNKITGQDKLYRFLQQLNDVGMEPAAWFGMSPAIERRQAGTPLNFREFYNEPLRAWGFEPDGFSRFGPQYSGNSNAMALQTLGRLVVARQVPDHARRQFVLGRSYLRNIQWNPNAPRLQTPPGYAKVFWESAATAARLGTPVHEIVGPAAEITLPATTTTGRAAAFAQTMV